MPYIHVEHRSCKLPEPGKRTHDYDIQPGTIAICSYKGCSRVWRMTRNNGYSYEWEEGVMVRNKFYPIAGLEYNEPEQEKEWRPSNEHYGDARGRSYPPQHPGYERRSTRDGRS